METPQAGRKVECDPTKGLLSHPSSSTLSGPSGNLREATMSQATTCFEAGGVTYRIPALLYIPGDDTFLAFAEKRSSARDEDAKYLVLRRGRLHGSSVKWGPVEELSALVLPGRRTMNPCPLYDARSSTIFLFCICVERGKTERRQIWRGCSAVRLCYTTSTDSGR
ncbi:PREDICTED: sialidase-3-like, partial [Acanthisitta chloris]|uniref:sialidase-3-like n=1 Tax=Acanthisitta chloris TaxID=57068 RepID=UPI0004F0F96B